MKRSTQASSSSVRIWYLSSLLAFGLAGCASSGGVAVSPPQGLDPVTSLNDALSRSFVIELGHVVKK